MGGFNGGGGIYDRGRGGKIMGIYDRGMVFGAVVALLGVVVGGWLVFKSKSSLPGERLFGGVPRGEVFTIPDPADVPENPEDDEVRKTVMERTGKFLKQFEGGIE